MQANRNNNKGRGNPQNKGSRNQPKPKKRGGMPFNEASLALKLMGTLRLQVRATDLTKA